MVDTRGLSSRVSASLIPPGQKRKLGAYNYESQMNSAQMNCAPPPCRIGRFTCLIRVAVAASGNGSS